ncbi:MULTISPECIES: hypothetical protein [Aeromonas]|uniref:hypothetical protein n=1 Tax=Aeromonas TaxID=642 RepID=UPI001C22E261|nr:MULTISPECIES: hypothetical protein [Aeromonas]MDX7830021.1 hypothetical protein [Aeromonas dhakensis]QXA13771.1 hypothetical protein I6L33_11820 [Aeromonas sp. FDAARGOS 1403]
MKSLIYISIMMLISGCSTHAIQNNNGAKLVVWDSNLSAGVSPAPGQKMCMQLAITSENKQTKNDVVVNDSVANLIKAGFPREKAEEMVRIQYESIKLSQAINVSTEKTSFLIAGGFYLCQLQMNGMPNEIVAGLAEKWLSYASNLESKTTVTQKAEESNKGTGEQIVTTKTVTEIKAPQPVPVTIQNINPQSESSDNKE